MIRRTAPRPAAVVIGVALAAGPLLAPAVAWPAEPGISKRMTREELQRTWDLDRNGRIDEGEAAVAASKMRQERARMRLRETIDPVTGRLLDEHTGTSDASTGLLPSWLEGEATSQRSASREWFDRWSLETAKVELADGDQEPGAAASSASGLARPRGLSLHGPIPGRLALPTTGSGPPVAARGGTPARPGYGSGVTRDLNAGRPIDRTAGAGGRAPTTTVAPLRGAPAPGGATAPRAASGGRTPGRPYDPY